MAGAVPRALDVVELHQAAHVGADRADGVQPAFVVTVHGDGYYLAPDGRDLQ